MATLIENTGSIALYYTPNTNGAMGGSYSVLENGTSIAIKDYGLIAPTFNAGDIVAADFYNGYRVVVFNGGHTWYVNSNWQKAAVGPNGADTTQLSPAEIANLGTGVPIAPIAPIANPTYAISVATPTITEGQIAVFNINTTNVATGTTITYNLAGVVASDVVGGNLTGQIMVDANGHAVINVPTVATPAVGVKNLTVSLLAGNNPVSPAVTIVDTAPAGPITQTLVESIGKVSLFIGSDGTFSAVENGVSTLIKDYGNPPTPFHGGPGGIVAADYLNGYRVVVFNGGHTWYVDANWQKAPVGPGGADTTQLTSDQIATLGAGAQPLPSYTFGVPQAPIKEGQTATFNLTTTNVAPGTSIPYALLGVTAADIVGGALTGNAIVDATGHATITVNTLATPAVANKNLSISLSVSGNVSSGPVLIMDALPTGPQTKTLIESIGKVSLFYTPNANGAIGGTYTVEENGISASIKDYGSAMPNFNATDIVAADYYNGYRVVVFNGGHTWYVDANWQKGPYGPNGVDTTQLSAEQIAVLGTGTQLAPTYSFSTPQASIKEGQTATFNLTTTNVIAGTSIPYTLLGVTAADVVGGSLTGNVVVDTTGHATITINTLATPTVANKNLAVSLGVPGNVPSGSVLIMDALPTGPQTKTLIESIGKVSLYYTPSANGVNVGTYAIEENGKTATIKNYGTDTPSFSPTDIVAADYYNGYRVVVFNGGHTWYVDSNWQKAQVGPNGVDTTQLSAEQIAVLGTGTIVNPIYAFTTVTPTISEGQTATFNLATTNVLAGTKISYALLGVVGSDIVGGSLTGSVVVDAAGRAVINVPTVANTHAGNKSLAVSLSVSGNWVSGPVALTDNTVSGPLTQTLIESSGKVSLFGNSDGTFTAQENGVSTFIKDYGNPPIPTHASNIIAADYYNGYRVVVFNGGHTWYVDSNWQKAPVGPNGADTTQLSTAQIASLLAGSAGTNTGSVNTANTPIVTKTLVEGTGKVALYSNSDGTFSASENGVLTSIKDYGNPPTPTHISNIVAADYLNGYRVVTFYGGHTWYVDSNWQKAPVGPNGADTTQLSSDQVSTMVGGGVVVNPVIVRSLVRSNGAVSLFSDSNGTFSVLENGLYNFVKDLNSNTPTHAAISGAGYYNGARIVLLAGGSDNTNFWYVDSSWSKAPVGPAGASEGVLTAAQLSSIFTSAGVKVSPTYNIAATSPSVVEGQVASFDLNTTNLAVGTKIDYALLGVVASDIVGGQLTGSVVVDASGHATISVPTVANTHAGNKNLSVSLSVSGNVVSGSLVIKDLGATVTAPTAAITTAVIAKTMSDVQVVVNGTSAILKDAAVNEVTAVLDKVQRIKFADSVLALDIDGTAGQGYRLYKAAFDRKPDAEGLGFWIKSLDNGASLVNDAAQGFLNSPEFTKIYGVNSSNATFIKNLYQFVLHRTPDADGYKFWDAALSSSPNARAQILTDFSNSLENIDQVSGLVANGIQYKEFIA